MEKNKNLRKALDIGLVLLIMASFACVCYYIFYLFKAEITSDCTDSILWAEAMVTSGKLFSPTYKYAGFIPFGGQTLMYPFVKVFGVTMMAQMLSMLTFLILFALTAYVCGCEIFENRRLSGFMVFIMLATLCVSLKLREIFWGHIIYYSLGVLFFMFVLFVVCRIMKCSRVDKKFIILNVILGIWLLLTATDGLLSLVQCMLPMFAGVVLIWCFNKEDARKDDWKLYCMAAVMLLCGGVGYVIGSHLHGDMVAGYAQAYSSFDGSSDWTNNLLKLLPQWYQLLGVDAKSGELFMSAKGLINLVRIAYATLIIVIPVVMLFMMPKIHQFGIKLLVIAHWVMTVIIMMGYVFGRLSGGNWRLSPILCSGLMILVAFIKLCFDEKILERFGGLMIVVCMVVNMIIIGTVFAIDIDKEEPNIYYELADFLEENGLSYGYASFWNANVITLVSDSRVRVRNVEVDGELEPGYYQSESYWFDDQKGQDDYFLLLTKAEYTSLVRQSPDDVGGYYKYLSYDNYYVLIYDYNIMNKHN